jgi:hypothetical protein
MGSSAPLTSTTQRAMAEHTLTQHAANLCMLGTITEKMAAGHTVQYALIKKKVNYPHILGNSEGWTAKPYVTNDLILYGENICAFPHILGSPSSYMT